MDLTISEEFLLLAHHPEKGRFIVPDTQLTYGIIGALLLDMSSENRIAVEKGKLILKSTERSNNQAISEITKLMSETAKPLKVRHWLSRLERKSYRYKWIIIEGLESKRLMRIEGRKFLGIIPYRKCFLTENMTRNKLIVHIKNRILFQNGSGGESVGILGLIEACEMERLITTDREEIKAVRKALKKIVKDSPIADITNNVIREIEFEIFAAMAASAAATDAAAAAAAASNQ
ncbi:MAG TPA: GPP34 family phosphoprotein [Bacteroidales bacterium]|nr:GPP34 family phosphoprotein [Bacteroidales bacterium]HPT11295.1 GPP34 family phosphoprotein [Bacteroidales bacterium]